MKSGFIEVPYMQNALIKSLLNPRLYPHPVTRVAVVETHISWVLLTGLYAYKIKKPVNLGFLDFSTLARRRHYCTEELRLNRRYAPELYLDVVAITGTPQQPVWDGVGPVLEYAVKMQEFHQDQRLDSVLAQGALHARDIKALARAVADFHAQAERATAAQTWGAADLVFAAVEENFAEIVAHPLPDAERQRVDHVHAWNTQRYGELRELLNQRKRDGAVRECHGDLHLRNLVRLESGMAAFDCIEFNDDFRWIDVMSEVAFLLMDLDAHAQPQLAHHFVNAYLEHTGDYGALALRRFYQSYRAMVRAKVACIQWRQHNDPADAEALRAEFHSYLELAERYTQAPRPRLLIMHGLSGSGKSTVSQMLVEQCGFIRVRSDVERKRMHDLAPESASGSGLNAGIYTATVSDQVYVRLATLARDILGAGHAVVVDAAFLKRVQRERFRELAGQAGVVFLIVHCAAPEAQLRERITERARHGHDASEAGMRVLEQQTAAQEPLAASECSHTLSLPSGASVTPEQIRHL